MQSATPEILLLQVWPVSLSLAATKKIDVSFSSSAYLDVSVQRVSLRIPMYSVYGILMVRRTVMEMPTTEGDSPVVENLRELTGSRVPSDTCNPVGSRGAHPPSLNTT